MYPSSKGHARIDIGAHLSQILDLFGEDSWRRVYAGELEVRPPGAPTIGHFASFAKRKWYSRASEPQA
jgi:hypothetical protein